MHRRTFLLTTLATALTTTVARPVFGSTCVSAQNIVHTVRGPVPVGELGLCLPHEHVLSRFGAPPADPPVYDRARALREVVPYLKYLKELGVGAVADCTTYNFGRDAGLLRQLSEASGVHIITNTGWYGAADDRYVPERAYEMSVADIAGVWIREFEEGIDGTGIRPGFVKTAVDGGPLSEIDAKLVRAAALTHRATGLRLAIHTSDNPEAAFQQLLILAEEGVSPSAWTWTHAQNVAESTYLLRAAARGAWISLDGIKTPYFQDGSLQGRPSLRRHLGHLLALREAGYLDRVLLSHDGSTLPPPGKGKRPMDFLMTAFVPMLLAAGLSEQEIDMATVGNPGRYFGFRS